MRKLILIYLLIFAFISLVAQSTLIDSLENQLLQYTKKDSLRVNILNETAYRLYSINIDKTFKYAKQAEELADKLNYSKGKAESLRIIGIHYWMKADYPQALRYYQKSLKINEEIGAKKGIAKCLNNIGGIYNNKGNYSMSLKYYQKSLKINEEIGYKRGISTCLNNIGGINSVQGDLDLAFENYQKSLKINEEIEDKKGVLSSLNNIANIYRQQGNNAQALEYYQKSLKVNEEIGGKLGMCISFEGISAVYLKTDNYTKALYYAEKSLKIANELELLNYQKNILELISQIYAATNNYKKAYETHVLYKELNDSIFSAQKIKKITSLEYQYQYEKILHTIELEQQQKHAVQAEKEKQQKTIRNFLIAGFVLMSLLTFVIFRSFLFKRKSNRILEKQNQTLKELNATKNTFFSIIAHDLRGPLGSLYRLSEHIWLEHDITDKEKQKILLESLVEDAENTYNLLDNLLKWASSNSGNMVYKPQRIILNEIINENFYNFTTEAETKKISLRDSMEERIEVFADYEMINTIVRNLISNAIKFTPENGHIEILSRKVSDNKIEIGVSDSGVGIKAEVLAQLFNIDSDISTLGTKQEKGSGLGLKLCKEFVEKNKGDIYAESKEGIGTTFWITLPTPLASKNL